MMTYTEALEEIDEIVEVIDEIEEDYPEVWDKAHSRGFDMEDIRDRILSVRETIEKNVDVTHKQSRAINNWGDAIRGWHPDKE